MSGKKTEVKNVTIDEVPRGRDEVAGKLNLSQDVVATIAGLAAREIEGVARLGKSRLIEFGERPRRGVAVEVGAQEAALDLEVVIKYGYNLREVAKKLRQRIAEQVDLMAGRQVVEVNINVVDIELPQTEEEPEPEDKPRVR